MKKAVNTTAFRSCWVVLLCAFLCQVGNAQNAPPTHNAAYYKEKLIQLYQVKQNSSRSQEETMTLRKGLQEVESTGLDSRLLLSDANYLVFADKILADQSYSESSRAEALKGYLRSDTPSPQAKSSAVSTPPPAKAEQPTRLYRMDIPKKQI